ncbi:hypothetical protein HDU76_003237 [Blyttiomyces sp. JEL0837]|nr:hypothetical protein HDU76_003237 [Blyttiomyces sp. JEL0837]
MRFSTVLAAAAAIFASTASAKRYWNPDLEASRTIVAAGADGPAVQTTLQDAPANFTILVPGAPVMTGKPISIYYIFYGNFTDLEIARIENYAKHVSDPETKPNLWSLATTYYDDNGNYVNKVLKHGGSVRDFYSFGKNISTTGSADDPSKTDMNNIITSHIGKGKAFAYDPQGIYCLCTTPEVINQDLVNGQIQYGGYHFSYNTTDADNNPIQLNHAYAHTIGFATTKANLDSLPNGDTGRRVVDLIVDTMHHEIFEALSDPVPNTAWNDQGPNDGIGENGDACEYPEFSWPHISFTENTQNSKGRWYNLVINNQIYAVQDIWTQDKDGIQSCFSEITATRNKEYKAKSAAKNIVTAADGVANYQGPVQIPCVGYYINRNVAGYTTPDEDVCHAWFNGTSFSSGAVISAPLDIPHNYFVLSHNHAHYQWLKVDETNAILVKDTDIAPPTTANNRVFVVYQDNFAREYVKPDATGPEDKWVPVDQGAYYHCRALVNGVYRVGETKRTQDTCDLVVDGNFLYPSYMEI